MHNPKHFHTMIGDTDGMQWREAEINQTSNKMDFSQLTTEEIKAELQAREKAEAMAKSPLSETGFSYYGDTYHALIGGYVLALHGTGSVLTNVSISSVGRYERPCTREQFMSALERNFNKIREAIG